MLSVALKRLWTRPLLTLLSIAGVALAVGLVAGIPLFARAVSFVMLTGELDKISALSGRPRFCMRVYALPANYPLSLERTRVLEEHIAEAIVSEVGLPLLAKSRHLETIGSVLYTRDEVTPYGEANTLLKRDLNLVVLTGVASHVDVVQGEPMDAGASSGGELDVWLHEKMADEMGLEPGERFEVRDVRRQIAVPIRIAGFWRAADPKDPFWFSNPNLWLRNKLLARESDYEAIVEPLFRERLGFAAWYLILDDRFLSPEQMQPYAEGLSTAFKIIGKFVPESRMDASPMEALERAIERERNLTALLLVFSVPLMGFLLYFLTLISTITLRWQRRETAIMVSRGMRERQLLTVGLIEAGIVVGVGCVLGMLLGIELAQLMGYARSFMSFTWREPLPVSPTALSVPTIAVTVLATLLARLWPVLRSARTSVVAHERRRARAPEKPLWQRFYLDFALLVPVIYAYRQLSQKGTLVPEALVAEGSTAEGASWLLTRAPEFIRDLLELLTAIQDPLLFLVPALFTLACSLLFVRLFPLLMRIGDWLGGLGREATFYLAFRQLSRQSNQYTSALLLVITSLSLGAFMASMAVSLDKWLIDQMYYAVGADVFIRQMPNPDAELEELSPTQGAWILPVTDYLDVPGVTHAARVGMYPATIPVGNRRFLRGTFIGIDRLDVPQVVFFRPDFGPSSLGEMMNCLAAREDAILLSEKAMAQGNYEVGDKIHMHLSLWFDMMALETDFTVAGTFKYFPTVYEDRDEDTAVIGNLDFVFEQIGAVLIHNIWLRVEPDADRKEMVEAVEGMGVYVHRWVDVREETAKEQAKVERVGIFGTLTIGFLAAAVLSGVGLLVYNYASLQERLFRFTVLRAVGLALLQVVSQVTIEYVMLMIYGVVGGAAIGIWASRLFIPFFQAADKNVLNPPMLLPLIAWEEIGRISAVFAVVLIAAQIVVISAALRKGVFQALRMGDRE